ncbi:hypothetical protein O181_133348 [Austropuccinia psidii MF-1]|uniref:Uncharacterized protein n=1 Tax=Austropuccinia psidii MF-1 TaxID=1389203 RepID=A0A9Q3L5K4_9BASI|nr:hypothetical protein [Austropuccinia psidii MF-1]
MKSYLTERKFLGYPNTCKLLNGWHPLMVLTEQWRKNNQPQPKKALRPAPVASSRNSNVRKRTQAQNKGKHKEPATESQTFNRMPSKMCFRWPEPLWKCRKGRKPD